MANLKIKSRFNPTNSEKADFEELQDNRFCPNAVKFIYSIGEALGRTDLVSKKEAKLDGETITKYYLSSADLEWLYSKFS